MYRSIPVRYLNLNIEESTYFIYPSLRLNNTQINEIQHYFCCDRGATNKRNKLKTKTFNSEFFRIKFGKESNGERRRKVFHIHTGGTYIFQTILKERLRTRDRRGTQGVSVIPDRSWSEDTNGNTHHPFSGPARRKKRNSFLSEQVDQVNLEF